MKMEEGGRYSLLSVPYLEAIGSDLSHRCNGTHAGTDRFAVFRHGLAGTCRGQ